MARINAIITGVGGYVPDYVLTNEELSRMVDTSDEWIMTRVGIKERHILTEEGLGTSYMARKAAKQLIQKTGVDPDTRLQVPVDSQYCCRKVRVEECLCLRHLCSMCRIHVHTGFGCQYDSKRPLQEDYSHWC